MAGGSSVISAGLAAIKLPHDRHGRADHQVATDRMVSSLLSDRPGQNRDFLVGVQPSPGHQLGPSLAAAKQNNPLDD